MGIELVIPVNYDICSLLMSDKNAEKIFDELNNNYESFFKNINDNIPKQDLSFNDRFFLEKNYGDMLDCYISTEWVGIFTGFCKYNRKFPHDLKLYYEIAFDNFLHYLEKNDFYSQEFIEFWGKIRNNMLLQLVIIEKTFNE